MGRIKDKFHDLGKEGKKALIVYLTAGDPDLTKTKQIIRGLDAAGVDLLKIGVPFSDPTADEPTIQAASQRALKNGTTLSDVLEMIEAVREFSDIPIVLIGYYNPFLNYGNQRFAERAKASGVDGIVVVDLPPEEAAEMKKYTDKSEIDFISVIAPTTPSERIKKISKTARGFLYYIPTTEGTKTAKPHFSAIKRDIQSIKGITRLPIIVGFGIATREQVRKISLYADGTVIGGAFVRLIQENSDNNDLVNIVSRYVKDIKTALASTTTTLLT